MFALADGPGFQVLLPLAAFAFVMSITPGPNNFMLLSSGARFGLLRSVPHLLGVTLGFAALLGLAYAGVAALLLGFPVVLSGLTLLCAAYLGWLAWSLLRSEPPAESAAEGQSGLAGRPMTTSEAALFQFVNPKGWAMAVSAVGLVAQAPLTPSWSLALLLIVCSAVNLPCVFAWAAFGAALRRALQRPLVHRAFTTVMAVAIALTALWMLRPLWSATSAS